MRVLILALTTTLLIASTCHALSGPRLRVMGGYCTRAVTGETEHIAETETPTNYFSGWTLTGGPCGTIYHSANWDDYTGEWVIHLFSDVGHTNQIGMGVGVLDVSISGTVSGSVVTDYGPGTTLVVEGTLTR